jgi:hypothetical protein
MAKWADYCISAVRFNSAHTHIDRVQTYPDLGEKLGSMVEIDRARVVSAIKGGTTFVTIFRNSEGNWRLGQRVYIVKISGIEYIKTVEDNTTVDNLDKLPEF